MAHPTFSEIAREDFRVVERLALAPHERTIDTAYHASNNQKAMRTWMTRWTRPIGWTLALAFAVALSANCATGEEMTEAQKDCCAAMGHDCGRMAQEEDCCSHEGGGVAQFFATAKGSPLAAPALLLMPFAVLPELPTAALRLDFAHLVDVSLKPSRVPKYLLDSTLLI